jgi:acyl-CoA dehydrogenase
MSSTVSTASGPTSRHGARDTIPPAPRLADRMARVAAEVAGPFADEVDRESRFPSEAISAMGSEGLLSAMVPTGLGGAGASLSAVADAVATVAKQCASTGMVFAMHQIQVACLVRHGVTPHLTAFLRDEVVGRHALLASATTELGVGGDVRTSLCAVAETGERFTLLKQAPVISYGQYADAVLATARRSPDSPPNDQVLVLCRPPGLVLEPTSGWDTMGFRGTCSLGFLLRADATTADILPVAYSDISSRTMLPVSHILWAHVWLGIADAAVARSRAFVRAEARKKVGVTPPAAVHLAELMSVHLQFESLCRQMAQRFDAIDPDSADAESMGFAIAMNSLKVAASTLVVDIVGRAVRICGMAAYREDSPFSMGRLLRDAHGAALMVNNDRILANSAQLLLVGKDG